MEAIKNSLRRITKRQWLLMAYLPIHMIWYLIAEAVNVTDYTVIYSKLDDLIPFCEWFIFPYLSWFLYMLIPGFYFLAKDHEAFEKYLLSLFIGFFISMTIISIWHTGQDLRLDIDAEKNFASWIVAFVYDFDTNTNVFPSMHVVGALAVALSVAKSKSLGKKTVIQVFNWLLAITIIAATVLLKQHSILDIFGAIIIEIPVLVFVYRGTASRLLDRLLKEKGAGIKE